MSSFTLDGTTIVISTIEDAWWVDEELRDAISFIFGDSVYDLFLADIATAGDQLIWDQVLQQTGLEST